MGSEKIISLKALHHVPSNGQGSVCKLLHNVHHLSFSTLALVLDITHALALALAFALTHALALALELTLAFSLSLLLVLAVVSASSQTKRNQVQHQNLEFR